MNFKKYLTKKGSVKLCWSVLFGVGYIEENEYRVADIWR